MKYTSEIIHEIIETEGHIAPSTFHYESECKKEWIGYSQGAYPKLTDYEGEWINYYLKNIGIGKFPYLTFTNITQATAENCVPIRFKSAILKGQTLVNNMCHASYRNNSGDIKPDSNGYFINDTGLVKNILPLATTVFKTNTTYTIILILDEIYEGGLNETQKFVGTNTTLKLGVNKKVFTTPSTFNDTYTQHNIQISGNFKARYMILEGDYTSQDIPYFSGMQSVKVPVLTTTGKNLFNDNYTIGKFIDEMGIDSDGANTQCALTEFMPIKGGANVKLSNSIGLYGVMIFEYDANKKILAKTWADQLRKTRDNTRYYRYRANLIGSGSSSEEALKVMMMEYGTQATSYEPFKSNTLTVNEPVELRGIGEVQDTLDCLTGEVIERVGEIVLDGSQSFIKYDDVEGFYTKGFYTVVPNNLLNHIDNTSTIICNQIKITKFDDIQPNFGSAIDSEGLCVNSGYIKFRIDGGKASTVEELNTYLSKNPIKILIPFIEPTIKTVDLKTINEKGETTYFIPLEGTMNVQSSGEIIQPTFDMSVPVEAITQNLESFIEEE